MLLRDCRAALAMTLGENALAMTLGDNRKTLVISGRGMGRLIRVCQMEDGRASGGVGAVQDGFQLVHGVAVFLGSRHLDDEVGAGGPDLGGAF